VATWDTLSLMICMGVQQAQPIQDVPTIADKTSLALAAIDSDSTRLTVDPWPFQTKSVMLVFEGRMLSEPFTDETAMRSALQTAPWVTTTVTLMPSSTATQP